MVNIPKERKTFCAGPKCRKHTMHKVTQYKSGKASGFAQGRRRYDRKQQGFGGQTKPVFHKKVRARPHPLARAGRSAVALPRLALPLARRLTRARAPLPSLPLPSHPPPTGQDHQEGHAAHGVQGLQVQDAAAAQALQAL